MGTLDIVPAHAAMGACHNACTALHTVFILEIKFPFNQGVTPGRACVSAKIIRACLTYVVIHCNMGKTFVGLIV
ncbi:hypothetical protein [Oxyplasma meridianum]|uniref:hypothetical protein n=1 Tax=Oxyplasma meridianum TaxID=3073602 RepID=UPI00372D27B5